MRNTLLAFSENPEDFEAGEKLLGLLAILRDRTE